MEAAFINAIETKLLARGGRRTATGGIEFRCFVFEVVPALAAVREVRVAAAGEAVRP